MWVRFKLALVLLLGGAQAAESWAWRPFEPVQRPPVPAVPAGGNAIDAFVQAELDARGLNMRPEAPREVLLRRVHLDLIGLSPTPEERAAFLADTAPGAYDRVVDRLLGDPRHAERWARHWMDVWRYSDWAGWTDGKQIRDSQPHIWRWRDWIVESLAADKGYDRMLLEMLAADELDPDNPESLRATGFLARNYKMLSREQWMEDTVKHTGQAFMGLTTGCAKCHDHFRDPIRQADYYALRAIFEPHQVRLDQVPGQADTALDGLPRVYDADVSTVTYLLTRGDERFPDKSRVIPPGVPPFLGGNFNPQPVALPFAAVHPLRRESVRANLHAAAEKSRQETAAAASATVADAKASAHRIFEAHLAAAAASARVAALDALLATERLEDAGRRGTPQWQAQAEKTTTLQFHAKAAEARLAAQQAGAREFEARMKAVASRLAAATAAQTQAPDTAAKLQASEAAMKALDESVGKSAAARKSLLEAEAACAAKPSPGYAPREEPKFPDKSSGRRLAFARWLVNPAHPLTARVAVNHVWCRHFGHGLVPTTADFGNSGRPPSHPGLLDWLAAEFTDHGWHFRHLHRLIVTSAAYRQASQTGGDAAPQGDPDNVYLWHFAPRRLEAEAVRDNLLWVTGGLDLTRGGPEIDQALALTSPRRSLYLRCAQEKQPEFLQIFDGPSVVECYERKPSVIPQQALALLNSELAWQRAAALEKLPGLGTAPEPFVTAAFLHVLGREPTADEHRLGLGLLADGRLPAARRRTLLLHTLLNHHEFLTIR